MHLIGPEEYNSLLIGGEKPPEASGTKTDPDEALRISLDLRKFEIEMYLKRTTYFWTLLGAALAGYFAVQAISPANMSAQDKKFFSFVISVIGCIISFGWCMANKGSKYWHENWENHAMALSKEIIGPIFNITLSRPKSKGIIHSSLAYFTQPGNYSVTKVNILLSWFMFFIWVSLLVNTFQLPNMVICVSTRYVLVGSFGILAFIAILFGAKSFQDDYEHVATFRESNIAGTKG